MDFNAEMIALAMDLIAEFGGPAELVRTTRGFNKATGRETPTTSTSTPVQVIIAPQEVADADGRRVTRTIATMLVEPHQNDKLMIGQQEWIVGNVTTIFAQNLPVVYKAVVE